jgi:hypothetical protein
MAGHDPTACNICRRIRREAQISVFLKGEQMFLVSATPIEAVLHTEGVVREKGIVLGVMTTPNEELRTGSE